MPIGVNLTQNGRLETASTRNFTHLRGFQNLDLTLVRAGGLCLCSREFHSPIKLTPMGMPCPYRCTSRKREPLHMALVSPTAQELIGYFFICQSLRERAG
jgi:hypothetical protein